jgi:2,3-bisphosphoglycerate-dependent phosphoglycerate mutase
MRNSAKKGTTYFADEEARKHVKGIPDHRIPLTAEGHRQAALTGVSLRGRFGAPDYVYHSGYLRTKETVDGILDGYGPDERARIQVRENPFIRERHAGYTYDMTEAEAEAAFPWLREYWRTFGDFLAQPPGGESLVTAIERIYLFNSMLFRDRVGQKVFVVTHGGMIRCFRFLLEHWEYERALKWPPGEAPQNCGLTVYQPNEQGRLVLREHNTVCWR